MDLSGTSINSRSPSVQNFFFLVYRYGALPLGAPRLSYRWGSFGVLDTHKIPTSKLSGKSVITYHVSRSWYVITNDSRDGFTSSLPRAFFTCLFLTNDSRGFPRGLVILIFANLVKSFCYSLLLLLLLFSFYHGYCYYYWYCYYFYRYSSHPVECTLGGKTLPNIFLSHVGHP